MVWLKYILGGIVWLGVWNVLVVLYLIGNSKTLTLDLSKLKKCYIPLLIVWVLICWLFIK